jgi:hypothetical protein
MKRIRFFLVIIVLFLFQFIQAGGVGISPVHYEDFFEPGLTKEYAFHSFSADADRGVELYVKGDLSEFATLSTDYLEDGGEFIVTISLPNHIEKPGTHKILVGARESTVIDGPTVGGIASIQGRIDILVPYPGRYAEAKFKTTDVNKGEDSSYQLEINSLGTQSIKVNTKIEVYDTSYSEVVVREIIPEIEMAPEETKKIQGLLKTSSLPPGDYRVYTTIDWGETIILNETLRVGEFLIEVVDYDYMFEQGKINPFNLKIKNKWNTKIEEVYAEISITDEENFITSFKTVRTDTKPWETKNITGYFDATNLDAKRYIALIVLSYGKGKTAKRIAIYVDEPPVKTYRVYIIAATIVAVLLLIAFIYLIWKVIRLSKRGKQNAKKK